MILDVRDIVRLEDIMVEEKLGPNSSFIRAFDLISERVRIKDEGRKFIDMPGQFEIKRDLDFKNFIIDNLLFTILSLRFDFPILRIFTKKDLIGEDERELLLE